MYGRNLIGILVLIAAILIAQSTLASAKPGISVDVTPVNPQVVPPGTATYSVTVTSSSTEEETVNLSIVNPRDGWSYLFSENDFLLLADETKNVELSVTVPEGTPVGDYLHDVRGFAVVPGFEGVLDEETFYLNVLTTVIPEFTTIAIPVAAILGLVFLFNRRRRG